MTSPRGVTRTGSILDRIVADKQAALDRRRAATREHTLRAIAVNKDDAWGLSAAIREPRGRAPTDARVQIVAEVKKASPSKGIFDARFDYKRIARDYVLGGAAGISVLTEENYFLGSLEHLRDIRRELYADFPGTRPSLLRKDFLISPYELVESLAYGADNVLLIAALLDDALLRDMIQRASAEGLDALVEVHTEAEAERAVAAGGTLFGINNRDLHTFEVDLATTERIRPLLPLDAVVIGESGVHTKADVERLHAAGVNAILVGEAFMTSADIAVKMDELRI